MGETQPGLTFSMDPSSFWVDIQMEGAVMFDKGAILEALQVQTRDYGSLD